MKKYLLIIFTCLLIIGCSSNKYGHTLEEWNNLTEKQRVEIKKQIEERQLEIIEDQHKRNAFSRLPNIVHGTRSNVH